MSDVEPYHAHCNTEEVMAFLGGVARKRDLKREVQWYIADQARHGHTFWALERKYDRALLGFCGLIRVYERQSPIDGKLEIGWRMRADKWRCGYAFEAASAVIDWAEWELPGEPLYARIHRDNFASWQLARKLGMRRDRAIEAEQAKLDNELFVFRLRL